LVLAAACLTALAASACAVPSVNTAPAQAPSSPAAATGAAQSGSAARVGDTLNLTGNSTGEKVAVTLTRIFRNAHSTDQFMTPDHGKHFYAVQFRLTITGSAAYSDSPSNGAAVVDASGQTYQADLFPVRECQSFPGTENIAAGSSGLGCIVFQVPNHVKIAKIQFTLDSGFASDHGQWNA
jgi:hypothetical protein